MSNTSERPATEKLLVQPFLGLLLTILAAELFWSSAAGSNLLKFGSIALSLAGVLVAGWSRSRITAHLLTNSLFGVGFGAYLALASMRHPGLIKDAWPHETAWRLLLFCQWAAIAFVAACIVTGVTSLFHTLIARIGARVTR